MLFVNGVARYFEMLAKNSLYDAHPPGGNQTGGHEDAACQQASSDEKLVPARKRAGAQKPVHHFDEKPAEKSSGEHPKERRRCECESARKSVSLLEDADPCHRRDEPRSPRERSSRPINAQG